MGRVVAVPRQRRQVRLAELLGGEGGCGVHVEQAAEGLAAVASIAGRDRVQTR